MARQPTTRCVAWCEPTPVQRPHPPIAIGGNGERRTLRLVAEHAQHWNSTLTDVDAWKAKGTVLDRHCADVGRDPVSIERSVNVRLAAGDDPRSLQPVVASWKDAGADVCIVYLGTPTYPAVMEPLPAALDDVG